MESLRSVDSPEGGSYGISDGRPSAPQRGEENAAELRVTEQRERRLAMPVEVRGLVRHRDDAVDAGELDERVDAVIVQARRQQPEGESDPDLGAEPIAPARFVLAKARLAQIVGAQRGVERLGGELPADQAVVDAA